VTKASSEVSLSILVFSEERSAKVLTVRKGKRSRTRQYPSLLSF
jgi:hypothetical protein